MFSTDADSKPILTLSISAKLLISDKLWCQQLWSEAVLWCFTNLISCLPGDIVLSQLGTRRKHISVWFFFPLLLSDCTIYCISCFSKRIKLTSILLSRGVALTDQTRTALSELKCYDEYLNWNWFYNLSSSLVSLRPETSDINRYGFVECSGRKRDVWSSKIHWLFSCCAIFHNQIMLPCF